jgi:hypothetical protein
VRILYNNTNNNNNNNNNSNNNNHNNNNFCFVKDNTDGVAHGMKMMSAEPGALLLI